MNPIRMSARAFFAAYPPAEALRPVVVAIRPILEALECEFEVSEDEALPVEEFIRVYERRRSLHARFGSERAVEAFDELLVQLGAVRGRAGAASIDPPSPTFNVIVWLAAKRIVGVLVLPPRDAIALKRPAADEPDDIEPSD